MSMQRGVHANCINRLLFMGFDRIRAEVICASKFFSQSKDEVNVDFVDAEEGTILDLDDAENQSCVNKKISIFKNEHPDWSHQHVIAAAIGYCKQKRKQDAIKSVAEAKGVLEVERVANISLSKFVTLVKNIKSKKGMKVGGMGVLPFKTGLPMKNLNRLQTKLERLFTEEQKWLTMEELLKRNRYMTVMKKGDSEPNEDSLGDIIFDYIESVVKTHVGISPEWILKEIIDKIQMQRDSYWVSSPVTITKVNDGLNNIIKCPVILAREMIKLYEGGKVKHFASFKELKLAVEELDKLPVVIEHQDEVDDINRVGWIKELRADSELKGIRGVAYLVESKLPIEVRKALSSGIPFPVSIGFFCRLGDSGTWEGKDYDASQEGIVLHHLAICVASIARCPTGYCGLNLDSIDGISKSKVTILNKGDYFINICKLLSLQDNKTETNKQTISKINEEIEMQEDSFEFNIESNPSGKIAGNEPKDLEAFLTKLRKFMAGQILEDPKITMARMLSAFKDSIKSDETMEQKDIDKLVADAVESKNAELAKLLEDSEKDKKELKELKEKKRLRLVDSIKGFTDKYSEDELKEMPLKELEIVEDATIRFQPSYEKPDATLPTKGKEAPEKMKKDSGRYRRKDPRELYKDINKDFDLSGLM